MRALILVLLIVGIVASAPCAIAGLSATPRENQPPTRRPIKPLRRPRIRSASPRRSVAKCNATFQGLATKPSQRRVR